MSIQDIKASDCQEADFFDIVKKFQQLDKDLRYPNSEGNADKARIVKAFEHEFMDKMVDIMKYY